MTITVTITAPTKENAPASVLQYMIPSLLFAMRHAITQKEVIELLQAFPDGEQFKMDNDKRGYSITITKNPS